MRSQAVSTRLPTIIIDMIRGMMRPGQPLAGYPSFNAAIIGSLLQSCLHPPRHDLTIAISRLHPTDQDLIHDLAAWARSRSILLADIVREPLTADSLLAHARAWKAKNRPTRFQVA